MVSRELLKNAIFQNSTDYRKIDNDLAILELLRNWIFVSTNNNGNIGKITGVLDLENESEKNTFERIKEWLKYER